MHDPYDDEDDGYSDDDYDQDYPKDNPYQWYYKFDIGPDTPISKWISDIVNNIVDPLDKSIWDKINNEWGIKDTKNFKSQKFPVNSWNPGTVKGYSFQYLGSNYQGSPIWKKQYFAVDKISIEYIMHLQSHAKHFLNQPVYYEGMFEILN